MSAHGSRLLQSFELLRKTRADISREEDNPEVRGRGGRALSHIHRALQAAEKAHADGLKQVEG